jgi:hypothetical protein
MRRILRHLTFANVVSVMALVFALGGTAVASVIVTSNSQVAKNTISGHLPPSGDHANIIGGSLATQDLALSAGRTYSRRAQFGNSNVISLQTILTLPGFGTVQGDCFNISGTIEAQVDFKNTSAEALDAVQSFYTIIFDEVVPPNGATTRHNLSNTTNGETGADEFVIGRDTGSASRLVHVIVTGLAGSSCVFQAQATEQVG